MKPPAVVCFEPLEPRQLLSAAGFTAVYFDSADLNEARNLQGASYSAVVTSLAGTDSTNGGWGSGKPEALRGGVNTWAARFTATLSAPESGDYTLRTWSDDGVRLWIDGELVIDEWSDHAPRFDESQVTLEAGQEYQLKIEYYENIGGAELKFEWDRPSTPADTFEVVSSVYLDSGQRIDLPSGSGFVNAGDGFLATYYDGKNIDQARAVQGIRYEEVRPNLNSTSPQNGYWQSGKPAALLTGDSDTWSARFTATLTATETGVHTFRTYSDDGVRLRVDGELIVDNWTDHGPTYDTGTISLEVGEHYDIEIEYYENGGGSRLGLTWNLPSMAANDFVYVPTSVLDSGMNSADRKRNFVNVRDYGAKGDGITDDWLAIQQALNDVVGKDVDSSVVYIPDGTYRISDTLYWRRFKFDDAGNYVPNTDVFIAGWKPFTQIQGQSRGGTVIELADGTFTDPSIQSDAPDASTFNPQTVIYTASQNFSNGTTTDINGRGGQAFDNGVRDLTIDARGNAGAVGLSYQVSNNGTSSDLNIYGDGIAGINISRGLNGPGLVSDVLVNGFDHGVRNAGISSTVTTLTFDKLTLRDQEESAIILGNASLNFRDLRSVNDVPVVEMTDRNADGTRFSFPELGFIAIADSEFITLDGGPVTAPAIDVSSVKNSYFLSDITVDGYTQSFVDESGTAYTGDIVEVNSTEIEKLFTDSPSRSLNLPVEETPEYTAASDDDIYYVTGVIGSINDELQAAFDSNKPVIAFESQKLFFIDDTIVIPEHVRKLEFNRARLKIDPSVTSFNDPNNPKEMIRVATGGEPLIIDGLRLIPRVKDSNIDAGTVGIKHTGTRTLAMTSWQYDGRESIGAYHGKANIGNRLFLEDVYIFGQIQIEAGQKVWARQLNTEKKADPKIVNAGDLWVLGLKTEGGTTIIKTEQFGRTEVIGGSLYPSSTVPTDKPAFVNDRGQVSLSYASRANTGSEAFTQHVQERRSDTANYSVLSASQIFKPGTRKIVSLYRGGSPTVTEQVFIPASTSGGTIGGFLDVQATDGWMSRYTALAIEDTATYQIVGAEPGDYDLKLRVKKQPNGGTFQIEYRELGQVNFIDVGEYDFFQSSGTSINSPTIGSIKVNEESVIEVRFKAIGSAAPARLVLDNISLVPAN